jgi:serine/threonine-protein kinase
MPADEWIGAQLAGYRIEGLIRRGGMGIVYRAEHLRLRRKVALKLLAPELAENGGFRARFERESRVAALLDHPNIVPLFEAGEADGLLFIAMRYVEGTDLRALLDDHAPLEPERALAIAAQVGSALDAAHIRGLVHRDVKPGNILIAADGGIDAPEHCYLADFGLTKDTSSPVELTATGTFVGTIDYIAPEQIEGAKPDGRGDQYALACVLYECLTGRPPFPRDDDIVVMWAHLQDEPPTVTAARPELPPAIDAVIAQAMAKSPKDRFPTCTAMVAAATAALLPGTGTAGAHPSPPPPAAATRVGEPIFAPAPAAPTAEPGTLRPPAAPPGRAAARRRPLLVLGALFVIAASIAGALAGHGGGSHATASAAEIVSNGDLELRHDASWALGGSADAVPGLALSRPITLRARDGRIVAGRIARPGPGLLPEGLTASATDTVSLGATPAFRHQGVRAKGGAPATVFVVPTNRGPEAIACVGVASSRCEAVAATLHLRAARALGVEPSQDYAAALAELLRDQSTRERRDRRALRRAATGAEQSAVATSAARAQAALAVRARQPNPGMARAANDAVAGAIAGIARGYRDLGAAARTQDAGRYRAAGAALRRAHGDLAHAITALKLLGYEVQRGG